MKITKNRSLTASSELRDVEDMMFQCARDLYRTQDVEQVSPIILRRLCKSLDADRASIFSCSEGSAEIVCEWCKPGANPLEGFLYTIHEEDIKQWIERLKRGECVVHRSEGTTVSTIVPLEQSGEAVGFICVENPSCEFEKKLDALLGTLGYLYMMATQRKQTDTVTSNASQSAALPVGIPARRNRCCQKSDSSPDADDSGAHIAHIAPQEESALQLALEREIENRMRGALEAGEFIIHLQPKLDLKKDEIVGAEVLVRWRDPRAGLRLPSAFVPLFERNGFIVDLDLFVFEQVCALLHAWSVAGLRPIPLSVNLSRSNLLNPKFPQAFEQIREIYGVSPQYLEFELMETFALEYYDELLDTIDRIRRAGYCCSMDNFGSGYSSLGILKGLEVDTLKLNRAFFGGPYVETGQDANEATAVIDLARRLHMKTVAEGVETVEQLAFLSDVGCDMVQGYLVSRPLSVADFERLTYGTEVATAARVKKD